mmetsp:Transcript_1579/g.3448  ORF Transcript_1579/g.3448 Transcript_1579/m.3448 type:complete len:401 (+) Transcript_1579:202-1404(+)
MPRYNEGATNTRNPKRPRIEIEEISFIKNDAKAAAAAYYTAPAVAATTTDADTSVANQGDTSPMLASFSDELLNYLDEIILEPLEEAETQLDKFYEMRERFQRLKRCEKIKNLCPDYAQDCFTCSVRYGSDEQVTLDSRLKRVLAIREKILRLLYDTADRNCIDAAVTSSAAFIFDRYLSRFVPNYVRGSADLPHLFGIIGSASLFIAAKSQLARRDLDFVERFLHKNPYSQQILNVELKILVDLDWNIAYTSPISIVHDLLELLPRPCGDQEYDEALETFKHSVLHEVSHLTKLAAVTYGFVTKFPPSAIALAALNVSLEHQCSSMDMTIFNLTTPVAHFATMLEQHELGLSFGDEDVKQCHVEMIRHLESGPKCPIPRCLSPVNAADVSDVATNPGDR